MIQRDTLQQLTFRRDFQKPVLASADFFMLPFHHPDRTTRTIIYGNSTPSNRVNRMNNLEVHVAFFDIPPGQPDTVRIRVNNNIKAFNVF
ncbi:MAG TPA: hypothetical protein DIU00_16210 [Phycisphaerales bacterium]|nr:hypothetical protein [Phycisphaerales bacterium]